MEFNDVLNRRRSIRSYTGKSISEEALDHILTAANEAPIGMGKYDSIHLTLISNPQLLNEIDHEAAVFFGDEKLHPLYGAPLLVVVSSNDQGNVASANVGIVLENMALAAVNENVGHCDIYGAIGALNQHPDLVKKLDLPDGFTALGGIVLGVSDEAYEKREIGADHRFAVNRVD